MKKTPKKLTKKPLGSKVPAMITDAFGWADAVTHEAREKALEILAEAKNQVQSFLPGQGESATTGKKRRSQKDILSRLNQSGALGKLDVTYRSVQGAIEETLKKSAQVVSEKATDFLDLPSKKEVQKLHEQLDEISRRLNDLSTRSHH